MDNKSKIIDIFNDIMIRFSNSDPDAMEFFDKTFDEEIKKEKKNEETNKT